uniref:Cytochrome b6-f complex subunit PetP n=1 Tax=Periphykon beckeri TaxID=2006982 RepID=A0A1Z1M3M1_9FLOR|nr:cytochrome b6-f complex subunit PetP [Periphykon beckeri]ARW60431.1 cytochrome b6-f complex subunit PetP [Periphykon beckeri]
MYTKKYLIKINFIPNSIKKKINEYLQKKLKFVGYKQISTNQMIPILEFPNKQRIWIIKKEVT